MESKQLVINYAESSIEELFVEDRELLMEAQNSLEGAYSPYSNFRVASAVRLDSGVVFCGANQENSAYPSGLCAERVALYYAGAHSENAKVVSIAVVAQNSDNKFAKAYPCGACLQVLSEWEMRFKTSIRIIVQIDENRVQIFDGVGSLMPFSFSL
jgi:cytidine deaminase